MTPEEHKKRHQELYDSLDELVIDFIGQTEKLLRQTSILELMQWSYEQSLYPGKSKKERE